MGFLGMKTRTFRIPKGLKLKDQIINEDEDIILFLFEPKKKSKGGLL